MPQDLANLLYLLAAILFILGIKGLTHPRTAVRGNILSALGMLLATVVVAISILPGSSAWTWGIIVSGLVIGSSIGWVLAVRVAMTGMPELVALFNGFGGGASVFVAGVSLVPLAHLLHVEFSPSSAAQQLINLTSISIGLAGLIGAVTLTGSLVAYGKLSGARWSPKAALPGGKLLNLALGVACVLLLILLVGDPTRQWAFWILVLVSAVLGVGLVAGIGGADMPVVISLLNSYSGLAGTAAGFALQNNVLIIAGSLVGASGLILTKIMCRAMNRSLANVFFGGMGTGSESRESADAFYAGKVKSTSGEEVAMILDGAQKVVFVPGYGMAVAQAQHAVRDLANLLESRGVEVLFGIHPVAGRMPGHMNVLLAEANIPYDKLKELDEINSLFEQTDVTFVIGANDVVNPVAQSDPKSPIAGMPILEVGKSRTVVVIKRSLSPGFAGIPNPLFIAENTLMDFGDAKKAVQDIMAALKENG